ncbi:hypothetical protein F5Y18DRAFT_372009 [Xylariaceae sp. FL1019]|nr:hypothetical protein F5Y18DRAFT_372009 [Xylariaceae sp. FL1019]
MKILFNFIAELASSIAATGAVTTADDEMSQPGLIETSLVVLSKMLDCNTSNIIDESFKTVSQQLNAILRTSQKPLDGYLSQKCISYINRRLGVGDELVVSQSPTKQKVGSRAEFSIPRTLPGRRHDNDHANIADIAILPTHDEVVSTRGEYLPTNDPSSFHHPGIVGRIDREFRLLREDTIGQLRDAVHDQLKILQGQREEARPGNRQSLRTYTYHNAEAVDVSFEQFAGLDLLVRFTQPFAPTNLQKRTDWWTQSKRLQPGALVCIISQDGSVLFCVVSSATTVIKDQAPRWKRTDASEDNQEKVINSLADDTSFSYVHLNIAEAKDNVIRQALRWYQNLGPNYQHCLIEFPGVLLASFHHTLEALKKMSKSPDIPFIDLIAPKTQAPGIVDIAPPRYATKAGFDFDLKCLTKDDTQLKFSPNQHLSPQILTNHSDLDETQSLALLNSLSHELALIQGPPGTGKSYTGEKIIKALLANKQKGDLGPILCVCYTNHALDQLLEHLLDDGVKQIIRIGSRSKSERLEKVNLRYLAQSADRTRVEKAALWSTRNELTEQEKHLSESLVELRNCVGQSALQAYLEAYHPNHHQALFGPLVDDEGYQQVRHRPNQLLGQWLRSGNSNRVNLAPRRPEALFEADIWSLTSTERQRLYTYWQRQIRDPIVNSLIHEYQSYIRTKLSRERVIQELDLRCLLAADIVGVTTTGLARNLDLLRRMRCKVLMCEEAGEVLEAHNLTALLSSIEHCILIGDHLQLRPQIQNFDLNSTNPRGAQYSLDVSLFERLVNPFRDGDQRIPYDTLETQRRMHPSISELIRLSLYPSLRDGNAVGQYPEVIGMRQRLFWLHHQEPEDRAKTQDPTSTSHTNSFEIAMTMSLVQHLIRQGTYAPDDIAVITPYLGQLHRLRREMQTSFQISVGERDLEDLDALEADKVGQQEPPAAHTTNVPNRTTLLKSVRLATVDNFQGEEAKVVVISLVRSNNERRCGFLSTPNRINVILSRAQHGMYLIGNMNTYRNVPMWAKVIDILEEKDKIGTRLLLQCPRHPDHPIGVSTPDHFLQFSPEGGCHRQCDRRLSCGHACINRCHSQVLHSAVKCLERCPRQKKGCDHPCRLSCGDACEPKCTERLKGLGITLPCGHIVTQAMCWQSQEPSVIICTERVSRVVPGCSHTVTVPCHVDVSATSYRCIAICGDPQPCGHDCRSQCHQCKNRKDGIVVGEHHGICRQRCDRSYTSCRHTCQKPCHGQEGCPPCSSPCEVRCSHSKCSKQCHEPCAPCAEQHCSSACPHQQCSMPCAAPCDWVPCSRRCEKLLDCGHQCPSICGEACPASAYCHSCCSEDVKATVVDFIMGTEYRDVILDEDPCIFPDCGHFLTKSNMDGLMDLKAHYKMSVEDSPSPIALSNSSMPFSMDEIKTCPTCRGTLRSIARYGRIIRRATLDEATKKFIAWSHSEFLKLANKLIGIQTDFAQVNAPPLKPNQTRPFKLVLGTSRLQQLRKISAWCSDSRYTAALRLWNDTSAFLGSVRKEEQPLQRVANFVRHATRERKATGEFFFDESVLQVKGVLQATSLLLRCEVVMLTDFMTVRQPLLATRPELKLDFTHGMNECNNLINMAAAAKYPREEVEGHIYYAQFCAFARNMIDETSEPDAGGPEVKALEIRTKLKEQATEHLVSARKLFVEYPSTRVLEPELEVAETMLRDAIFYTKVSEEEMKAVYRAMSREFLGTGHWYTCENGHPFTVGECGMPMQQARCPECGAPVGGAHHQPAEGVRHANEIEDMARDMGRMGI